jgi:hypothetical protein
VEKLKSTVWPCRKKGNKTISPAINFLPLFI